MCLLDELLAKLRESFGDHHKKVGEAEQIVADRSQLSVTFGAQRRQVVVLLSGQLAMAVAANDCQFVVVFLACKVMQL
jgi:hypothetical protein